MNKKPADRAREAAWKLVDACELADLDVAEIIQAVAAQRQAALSQVFAHRRAS